MAELKALLFDLDGTLVQARKISWEIFKVTNSKFSLGVDSSAEFYELFNGNIYEALDSLALSNGVSPPESVRNHFQQSLRTQYLPELVPGIASVVRLLASNYTLIIVSSNTMESVRRTLYQNDLAECFAHVFSGEVTRNKHEAIRQILRDSSYSCGRQCVPYYDESAQPHQHSPDEVMLITDTVGDIEEGLDAGVRVCGVAWGMHSAERLDDAGAEFVCIWPEELLVYLRSEDGGPYVACDAEGDPAPPRVERSGEALDGLRHARELAASQRRRRRVSAAAGAGAVLDAGRAPDSCRPLQCRCPVVSETRMGQCDCSGDGPLVSVAGPSRLVGTGASASTSLLSSVLRAIGGPE